LGSVVLGATVFREPLARAAGAAGIASVSVANDKEHSIPVREQNLDANGNIKVHEQGTVSFGISSTANTVSLGTADHTLLDTASTKLASIDSQTSKLKFDSNGNLETASHQVPANYSCGQPVSMSAGDSLTLNCGPVNASLIVVAGFDDKVRIRFRNGATNVLVLSGSGSDGNSEYVIPLTAPISMNNVGITCDNLVEDCDFTFNVSGTATS
jgi:hypothetical protein